MNRSKTPIRIAIADSHVMFRQAITETIEYTKDIEVVLQANDGKDLSEKLEHVNTKKGRLISETALVVFY